MRVRRRIPVLLGLLIFVAAIAAVIELRKHAPPEPARLLPGADGFLYVNLQRMRLVDIAGKMPSVKRDPDYEQFVQATGFDFERDLAQAAFAVHYPSPATHGETRFSEVIVARLDNSKFRAYLRQNATSVETYRSTEIYSVPLADRTFRIAILGVEVCAPHLCTMIAGSNHDDPAVIHGIVDRSRKLASPFGGPAVLRQYYKYVPRLMPTLGWAIFKVNPSAASGMQSLLPAPLTLVTSVTYLGTVHLRAEAFTKDDTTAKQLESEASTFLEIFETAEHSVTGNQPNADFKRVMDSIKITQKDNSCVLTATVPSELIRKAVESAPQELSPTAK